MKSGALATALGLDLIGHPERDIVALAPLERATSGELSFVTDARHRASMLASQAGLLIVPPALADECPVDHLVSSAPYRSYADASWLLVPESRPVPGVHATAHVDAAAAIGEGVSVGAFASIGSGAEIGEGVSIGAGCRIAPGVRIGARTRLFDNVVLAERVVLGEDCRVQPGAVIGGEGFGYAPTSEGWQAIHQVGGVRIGDRVHIGANTTIDSGAIDATVVEDGVILDNLIQLGHNVHIGENTAIAAHTAVAGSTHIGKSCLIGGCVSINGHIRIGDRITITGTSFVSRSLEEPGSYGSGVPLQASREWRRTFGAITRLSELLRRVNRLEKNVANLRGDLGDGG